MISTNEEFCNESKKFLNKEWIYFNIDSPFDIENLAKEYVRNNPNFKYKDDVEAGVLVNCLEESGYIQLSEIKNHKRLYNLTKKGIDFISKKQTTI
ncbi:hypothetical protein [Flavobacterium sp.]|uniref:hypothetical protein n=1 Tax=Flavobacterium sp. TaxID=239 RepID=UPI0008BD985C|nr:hypothetical protein [Flavobacterium sp.]OGS61786.1 MAG: hypothetical protein A2X07_03160 [Flavobacteria bacterium GWF1_32_7]HBD27459.1 hypothetical protein [Flavobacterium sp.]